MEKETSYINFCNILRQDKYEIIQIWKERIKKKIEVANDQSTLILVDHLPEIISNLSDTLESKGLSVIDVDELNKKNELGKAHGRQRAIQTNYSLEEVLTEYIVLRSVIIEKIFSVYTKDVESTQIIHRYIDEGIQNAVIEFIKIQNSQIENGILELKKEKKLREEFVSSMTHDLRSPVTAAKMSAQMLKKNPNDIENVKKQVNRIISNIDRIDDMIQDLLDANLVNADQGLPIHFSDCNLKSIAEETLADLVVSYGDRFIVNVPTNLHFKCSKAGIRRILENLCTNAVKYGSIESPIIITMNKDAEKIFIQVHNKGSIIPKEEIDNLFDQFHRSKSAKSSGQKGWGIGLSFVKGLVEAYNGSISVVSNDTEGTVFKITLPRA